MQLVLLACPSCGGRLTVKPDDKVIECPYCKQQVVIDDKMTHVTHHIAQDDMEEAGYRFERGRQQAQKDVRWLRKFEKDPNEENNDADTSQTDDSELPSHSKRASRLPVLAIVLVSVCILAIAGGMGYALSSQRGNTARTDDDVTVSESQDSDSDGTTANDSWYIYGDHYGHPDNQAEKIWAPRDINGTYLQLAYSEPTQQFLNFSENLANNDMLITGHYREFYETPENAKGFRIKTGRYQLKNISMDKIDAIVEIKREDPETGASISEGIFSVPYGTTEQNIEISDDTVAHDVYVYPYGTCVRINERYDYMFARD